MVSLREVEQQLQHVGCNYKLWGRSEIRELCNILMPEEKIAQAVNGSYEGGFALLCVTNYRVLLVDRKPMLLTIEDIRYDMMAEVDYSNRMMGATLKILTPMRNLVFSSWSMTRLRKCVNYIQQRVMEIRQHGFVPQQAQAQLVGTPQPLPNPNMQQLPAMTPAAAMPGQSGAVPYLPMNPYNKVPLLTRRRRFPSFY
jgi:PH (Pleckstrin Homology) domain-containing protein